MDSDTTYQYDSIGRRTGITDDDGNQTVYAYNAWDHILLQFADNGDLTQRYLHGPVVDQILAAEDVTSLSSAGDVVWPLADNQGTIRDLVDSTGSVLNHLKYDAFGQITAESNSAVDFLLANPAHDCSQSRIVAATSAKLLPMRSTRFRN